MSAMAKRSFDNDADDCLFDLNLLNQICYNLDESNLDACGNKFTDEDLKLSKLSKICAKK